MLVVMAARRIPSLNWLRVFEAAAQTESFARAAQLLHLSPPAVSQQIRSLEHFLGRSLFVRHAKRVELTDAGRAFLPSIAQALASVENAAAGIFGPEDVEVVTLQAVTIMAMGWLPGQIAAFEAAHQHVRIDIVTADANRDFHSFDPTRQPDLQIAFGHAADFPNHARQLMGERLSAVGSRSLIAKIGTIDDLLSQRLFEPAPHLSGWWQMFRDTGLDKSDAQWRRAEIAIVDNTPLALMMAAQSLGLALARSPASDAMVELLQLQVCPLLRDSPGLQHYYLFSPDWPSLRPGARALAQWLLDQAKEDDVSSASVSR